MNTKTEKTEVVINLILMLLKYPSMTFSCPKCREDMKTKQEVVMSGRGRGLSHILSPWARKLLFHPGLKKRLSISKDLGVK